jgi:hypothetical protein
MFAPIDRLPQFDPEKQAKYRDRWQDAPGRALHDKILAMIRAGAGEDFLQWEFEQGRLGFLEDMLDLKGLNIFDEQFNFPSGDTFENINFDYAEFWHSKFNNAVFYCSMAFTRVHNCEFKRCIVSFNRAYATTFEKCRFVECEFVETNSFTNCVFLDTTLENCFIPKRLFFDCTFDQVTLVGPFAPRPFRMNPDSFTIDLKDRSDVLSGIEQAYRDGGVLTKARDYYFQRMQAVTRYNSATRFEMFSGFCKEYLAGYGVRPLRVLAVMVVAFLLSTLVFASAVGLGDGTILSAGALFTFGARADLLTQLGPFYRIVYVLTAFAGISLTALLITVLANVWFRER